MIWIRRAFWIAVFVGFLLFGWTFAAKNEIPVAITLPWIGEFQLSLWQALLLATALGVALTGVFTAYQVARLKLLSRRYRKMIRGLEAEVHQLRNLPLADAEPPAIPTESTPERDGVADRALGRGA